ncbi:MAG: cytochrome-c peroxidase [Planctomycetota bacterium]|jgi:cytochrome c peroxidase
MQNLTHCVFFVLVSILIANPFTHGRQSSSKSGPSKTSTVEQALTQKEVLGKKLFFDKNLSTPVGQACADCHAPETGFANPNADYPVSQGVHKDRFGNRNDLPAAYAAFSPTFHYDPNEELYVGDQFWDGRAADLAEQAKGPFLNALEMANPEEKTVVDKVRKSEYADLFLEVFGVGVFDDPNKAYDMIADAIAEYEKSSELNQFNSKYDLYLAGKVTLSEQEQRGLELFEDINKGKCAECHPSQPGEDGTPPLFTDFTYDNLGVPQNPENPFYYLPKELNPDGVYFIDLGLGSELNKPSENGKFKVPSLRNIAKTAPYLHNGIFKNLRQVVVFYNTRDVGPWAPPEVRANVNREELGDLGLTEQEVDGIVAFLQTLTDGYNSSEK